MNQQKYFQRILTVFCGILLLLSCLFCGCRSNPILPTGGYDYRMTSADGAFLGYPIPRIDPNPYFYSLPLQGTLPTAFSYDADKAEYIPLQTELCMLSLPTAELAVPCAVIGDRVTYFESTAHAEKITVYQGDIGGMAVALSHDDGILYLANEAGVHPIAEAVTDVCQVYTDKDCLLFLDENGVLYEYRNAADSSSITPISEGGGVNDAWYVCGADRHTVVFRQISPDDPHHIWYYSEDGDVPISVTVLTRTADDESAVYVRGTACILQGTNDSAYFYDIRSGERLDMDMGELYRFPTDTDIADLTLSPDGHFVYFYDIDFIYRMNLSTADLALAYNEAPIFEGDCILSSMTAVTDEIVLLSQASNEYTEFVPTITVAVFEEDIPELRHEDEKIDLDHHSLDTDE